MSSLKFADILLHSLMTTSTGAVIPVNPFLREVHLKMAKFKKKIQFKSHTKHCGFFKKTNQLNLVTEIKFYKHTKHINKYDGCNYLYLTFRTYVQYSSSSAVKG